MKQPKPISDRTYGVYLSYLRKARKEENIEQIQYWENTLRLSGREIPLPIDADKIPARYGKPKLEEVKLDPNDAMTEQGYIALCYLYQKSSDGDREKLLEKFHKAGREVPGVGERRQQGDRRQIDSTLPTPPPNDVRHGLDD